jgi:hypothetical protein
MTHRLHRLSTLLPVLGFALVLLIPAAAFAQEGDQGNRTLNIHGTLTDEGVECRALRGDDGQLYTLTGDLGGFQTGDRVRVRGKIAERTFCGQGTTIVVEDIKADKSKASKDKDGEDDG